MSVTPRSGFDTFCVFCAGPLQDVHTGWTKYLGESFKGDWPPKDGEWHNPPGYPVPVKSKNEIMRITQEDGDYWSKWVILGPLWDEHVSPRCAADSHGGVLINGVDNWSGQQNLALKARIHCGCLSFLCRITNSSPKDFYDSLVDSRYWEFAFRSGGLINFMTYYNMEGRDGQFFGYAIQKRTPQKNNSACSDLWWDPDTMEDTNWLLARPTVFPKLDPLPELPLTIPEAPVNWHSAITRVLHITELLDYILDYVVAPPEQTVLAAELRGSARDGHSESLDGLVKTIFNLLLVDKYFNAYLLEERQDLFLQLASHHAWMLPISSFDVQSWKLNNESIQFGRRQLTRDWRRYLLTYLRRDNPHVKNRFRMYRMALQCARGKAAQSENRKWSVGELGYVPGLTEDTTGCAWEWET